MGHINYILSIQQSCWNRLTRSGPTPEPWTISRTRATQSSGARVLESRFGLVFWSCALTLCILIGQNPLPLPQENYYYPKIYLNLRGKDTQNATPKHNSRPNAKLLIFYGGPDNIFCFRNVCKQYSQILSKTLFPGPDPALKLYVLYLLYCCIFLIIMNATGL